MTPLSRKNSRCPSSSERSISAASDLRVVVFSDAFRHRNGVGAYYDDLLGHLSPKLGAAELVCPGLTPEGKPQGLSMPLPGDRTQKLSLPGIPKAVGVMRRVRPHVVIVATPGPYGLLGMMLSKLFGANLGVGYHTQYDKLVDLYWNRLFGRFASRYLYWLDRMLFRRSRMVLANSVGMRDAAMEMGAPRVQLVGTPIDPRFLAEPTAPPDDAFGPVLFVGRLAQEKRLDLFLDAARRMPETRFIVAGDGPQAAEVRNAEAELPNLRYEGWLDRETLVRTLDASELLVLPSSVEAFGTVVCEAMARQRLAVVSDRCGILAWPELAEGVEAFGENASLLETLRSLAALPPEKRAEKRRLAREVSVRFSESTIDQWCEALLTIARGEPEAESQPAVPAG